MCTRFWVEIWQVDWDIVESVENFVIMQIESVRHVRSGQMMVRVSKLGYNGDDVINVKIFFIQFAFDILLLFPCVGQVNHFCSGKMGL